MDVVQGGQSASSEYTPKENCLRLFPFENLEAIRFKILKEAIAFCWLSFICSDVLIDDVWLTCQCADCFDMLQATPGDPTILTLIRPTLSTPGDFALKKHFQRHRRPKLAVRQKFVQRLPPLVILVNLSTKWSHLQNLQIEPPQSYTHYKRPAQVHRWPWCLFSCRLQCLNNLRNSEKPELPKNRKTKKQKQLSI